MKRREFLTKSITATASCLLGAQLALAEEKPTKMFNPYEIVSLGKTGIKTSRVGLGTGMRGGGGQSNHTRMGTEKFNALARGSFERGIRLYDSADMYGTHPFLAEALKQMPRKDYIIVTKISGRGRRRGMEQTSQSLDDIVKRFLKELNTDYIDVILMHAVSSAKWPEELTGQMEALEKLKKSGTIRAHGVSVHSLAAMKACVKEAWVDYALIRLNPYAVNMDVRAVEDIPKVEVLARQMRKLGKAVVGMKIIGEGRFRNSDERRDASIKLALVSGCLDAMVVGCETIEEVEDLAGRVRKVPVPGELGKIA
jgi:aryl-alcohol dehydrogenase-like predicted oxidoreductase